MAAALPPVTPSPAPSPATNAPPAQSTSAEGWASAMSAAQQAEAPRAPARAGNATADAPANAVTADSSAAGNSSAPAQHKHQAASGDGTAAAGNSSTPAAADSAAAQHKHQETSDDGSATSLAALMLGFAGAAEAQTTPAPAKADGSSGKVSAAAAAPNRGHAAHGAGTAMPGDATKDVKAVDISASGAADATKSAPVSAAPNAGAATKGKSAPADANAPAATAAQPGVVAGKALPAPATAQVNVPATATPAAASVPVNGQAVAAPAAEAVAAKTGSGTIQPAHAPAGLVAAAAAKGQVTAQLPQSQVQSVAQGAGTAAMPQPTATVAAHGTVSLPKSVDSVVPTTPSFTAPATSLAPSALAATVTALQKGGQNSAIIRLDPPDLGSLSVHLSLAQSGAVNVSFIPTTPQAAQLLHAGMDGFRQSMTSAGLTLGQAEVSGGGGQNPGQGQQGSQGWFADSGRSLPAASSSEAIPNAGVRAYA